MKLYCYYFKPDGFIEKERIICRKNKSEYAYKYISAAGNEFTGHLPFEDIGKVLCPDSSYEDTNSCCRMYLEEDVEITEEMRNFAKKRGEKIKELKEFRDKIYKEIKTLRDEFCLNLE